jgi:hypothetical protein
MLGNQAAAYLATPDGQETIKKFLSSPEGIAMLNNFFSSPEGKGVAANVLPTLLNGLNLPSGTQEMVMGLLQNR